MTNSLIDVRSESHALRRVALLLARYRQDSAATDPPFLAAEEVVDALLRAAGSEPFIDRCDVDRLADAKVTLMTRPVSSAETRHCRLLRRELIVELQELSDHLECRR